jgi:hypothetical protein
MKKIKKFLYFICFFIFLIELFSIISVKNKLLIFNQPPSYNIKKHTDGYTWRTYNNEIGPWHKISSSDRHIRRCFDVTYKSNNIGARDNIDYSVDYFDNAIILVGDSFAEGFGVNLENTFAKIISKSTGKNVVNLGAGGSNTKNNFKRFEKFTTNKNYSEIIYFLLPENDFISTEDDNEINNALYQQNYITKKNNKKKIKQNLIIFSNAYLYSYNLLRTIKYIFFKGNDYYKNNSYQFKDKEIIDQISIDIFKVLSIENKMKTLVIIPTRGDILNYKINKEQNYKNLYWYKKLLKNSEKYNVNLIDLMDFKDMKKEYSYYHNCDPHWNENGNKFAAQIYLDNLN